MIAEIHKKHQLCVLMVLICGKYVKIFTSSPPWKILDVPDTVDAHSIINVCVKRLNKVQP